MPCMAQYIPEFKQLTYNNKMKHILKSTAQETSYYQKYVHFKQPKIGGMLVPHKDSTFMYTEPAKLYGVWKTL